MTGSGKSSLVRQALVELVAEHLGHEPARPHPTVCPASAFAFFADQPHLSRALGLVSYVIDIGPGAGDEGGRVVTAGTPGEVSQNDESRTAPFLSRFV